MRLLFQALLVAALISAVAGGVFLFVKRSDEPAMEIVLPSPSHQVQVMVYISGAVRNPGVYTLKDGARLVDAVEAAGGATSEAELTSVNLAALVHDQDHWNILRIGEAIATTQTPQAISDSRININVATTGQLEALPKIGPVLSQAIVRYREANGPFASVDDLVNVSGIGTGVLSAIRDLVKVE